MMNKIAVIGSGTMGHGIAEVCAIHGYEVKIHDVEDGILKNAMEKIKWSLEKLQEKGQIKESSEKILSRIKPSTDFKFVVEDCDLMIEAVFEKIEVKHEIFSRADKYAPRHAILASNTSSLPITEISEVTNRKEKVIGLHFFNPPVLMKLVEVIRGKYTSDETLAKSLDFCKKINKESVILNKDVPGFIVNRILSRILNTACILASKGYAKYEEIDSALKFKLGFPMGIFEVADYSGLDIFYNVFQAITSRGFKSKICSTIEEKVNKKNYGLKSGEGFYKYPKPGEYKRIQLDPKMGEKVDPLLVISLGINEAAYLLRNGISSKEDIDKAVRLGLGYPKGLFEYADEFGIDEVIERIRNALEITKEEAELDQLLIDMYNKKMLGKKTKQGFYTY
jgi:3-hydroxyacyl-CoA dehydrogenase